MKPLFLLISLSIIPFLSKAQSAAATDSVKTAPRKIFTAVEIEPAPPGGVTTFLQYIKTNLQYPEVAKLLGINGKVIVSFWIDKTGKVVDVSAGQSLGAGCEYEAKKVVSNSVRWRPGIQNGHPVKVSFKVEVNFDKTKRKVAFKELKDADYGFVFNIKGTLCTLDEAQTKLGDTFRQDKIEGTEVFYNPDNEAKFSITGKKEVYLVKIKS
jgi:periplasmic protein TonB